MICSSVWNSAGSNITMSNMPAGGYAVYLYVWEDNISSTFDIALNKVQVQGGYSSGAGGHGDRLGPWPVTVTDGTIAVTCTPGDANLSGIEVWRLGQSAGR